MRMRSYLDCNRDTRRLMNASHNFAAIASAKNLAVLNVISDYSLEPFACLCVNVPLRVNFDCSPIKNNSSTRPSTCKKLEARSSYLSI